MVRLGAHVSIAGGVDRAVDRAKAAKCDIFQIFSSNPRCWRSRPLSDDEAGRFVAKLKESGLDLAVDHMPYLPNLASPNEEVFEKSAEAQALATELTRCEKLGVQHLVTHLGSHMSANRQRGQKRIASALETAFSTTENDVELLLENTARTKNSRGGSFQAMAAIIDSMDARRLGVCLDTCHLFAAGYELRTPDGLEATLDQFESSTGQQMLKLIHLNDCRGALGSRMDRHEHISIGQIGEQGFRTILGYPILKGLPMILETPVDSAGMIQEISGLARQSASGMK